MVFPCSAQTVFPSRMNSILFTAESFPFVDALDRMFRTDFRTSIATGANGVVDYKAVADGIYWTIADAEFALDTFFLIE